MGSVRNHEGTLFFDFRYQNVRCRESTKLEDSAANRKRMQKVLDNIEHAIVAGTFRYADYFPCSRLAKRFTGITEQSTIDHEPTGESDTPKFRAFIELWFGESLPTWRRSHAATVRSTIDRHLLPFFGDMPVGDIEKADILRFRAEVAQRRGRGGNTSITAKTINRIMQILSQAVAEAAERHSFSDPAQRIKRLKQRRVDIHPFSLTETRQIIEAVRPDYRAYMVVRFLTGMRTGEIHGLKWRYVDFEHRQILVRETIVRGEVEYTKTDGAQREIAMSAPVYDALVEPRTRTGSSDYVFCGKIGTPLDNDNFCHRVWYPLLRHLGMEKRRPYQTRHTCATLWLPAGENPEWAARQLGHVNTLMLFKTYSRFIPNLTRQDGSAFDSLVSNVIHATEATRPDTDDASEHDATTVHRSGAGAEGSAERSARQDLGIRS